MGTPPVVPVPEVELPKPTAPPIYTRNMPTFTLTPADSYIRTLSFPEPTGWFTWSCGGGQELCLTDLKNACPDVGLPSMPDWVDHMRPWFNCLPICGATCNQGYDPILAVCNRPGDSNLVEFLGEAVQYAASIQGYLQGKAVSLLDQLKLMLNKGEFQLPTEFTLEEAEFVGQLRLDFFKTNLRDLVTTFFGAIKDTIVRSQRRRRRLSARVQNRVDWSKFITLDLEFEAGKGYSGSGGIGFVFNTRTGDVKAYAFMCAGVQTDTGFGVALAIGFWDDEDNIVGSSIEFDLSWEVKGVTGTDVGLELGIWCGQPNPFMPPDPTHWIDNVLKYRQNVLLADMWAWGFSIGVGKGPGGPFAMGANLCVTSSPSH